jgi:hypothetical protein
LALKPFSYVFLISEFYLPVLFLSTRLLPLIFSAFSLLISRLIIPHDNSCGAHTPQSLCPHLKIGKHLSKLQSEYRQF